MISTELSNKAWRSDTLTTIKLLGVEEINQT
jgi:hypothetical protein